LALELDGAMLKKGLELRWVRWGGGGDVEVMCKVVWWFN